MAGRIAQNVDGVKSVKNDLIVSAWLTKLTMIVAGLGMNVTGILRIDARLGCFWS